jgi:hypothetical protein
MRYNFHESMRQEKLRLVRDEWQIMKNSEDKKIDDVSKKRDAAKAVAGKDRVLSFSVRNVFESAHQGPRKKKTDIDPELLLLEKGK